MKQSKSFDKLERTFKQFWRLGSMAQRKIANFTVGSLVATLFVAGAGVGVGVVGAQVANAVLYAPVITGTSTTGSNDLLVTFTDTSTDTLEGYLYTTNANAGTPTWKSCIPSGSDCTWVALAKSVTIKKLSTANSAMAAGSTYQLAIKACTLINSSKDLSGCGPISTTQSVVAGVPDAPTSVSGVPGNGQVTISWTNSAGNGGATIDSYTVTSSPDGKTCNPASLGSLGGANSCTVTGLTNGTSYTFTVKARNSSGWSPDSTPSSSVTPRTVPGAPTAVSASPGNGQATVSWTAPASNGGATIDSYTATVVGDATKYCTWTSGATSCVVSGLSNGTGYTFTVTAYNVAGASSPSTASSSVTPRTVPGAPTAVSASPGNGQATVSWTAPASNGGATIDSYTATVVGDATKYCTWTSGATSCVVSGLSNGTGYTFTVKAYNVAGASSPSTASSSVTPTSGVTVPGAPTAVSASPGNGQATVSWTAPASNGGATIDSYTATVVGDATKYCTWTSGATSCVVSGLSNGTGYTFTVTAYNVAGASSPSTASSSVTPRTVPGAPSIDTATVGNSQVRVSWFAPGSNGGATIDSYTVTSTTGGFSCTYVGSSSDSCTVTGLANGTSYTFKVRAYNVAGVSTESGSVSATPDVEPEAPDTATAIAASISFMISWTVPRNNGSTITGYKIEYSTNSNTGPWTEVTPNTWGTETHTVINDSLIPGLNGDQIYYFQVSAKNNKGNGQAKGIGNSGIKPNKKTPSLNVTVNSMTYDDEQTPSISTNSDGAASFTASGACSKNGSGKLTTVGLGNCVVTTTTVLTSTNLSVTRTDTITVAAGNPDAPTIATGSTTTGDGSITLNVTAGAKARDTSLSHFKYQYKLHSAADSPENWTNFTDTSTVAVNGNLTKSLSGLTNGYVYDIRVISVNASGNNSNPATQTSIRPFTNPHAPSISNVTLYGETATVSWGALTTLSENGGDTITAYTVEESSTATSGWVTRITTTNSSEIISGLDGHRQVQFRVTAANNRGSGPASTPSTPKSPGLLPHKLSVSVTGSATRSYKSASPLALSVSTNATDFAALDGVTLPSTLTYSVNPSDANKCEVDASGNVTAYRGSGARAGSCVINVSSRGNSKYDSDDQSFTVEIEAIDPDSPTATTEPASGNGQVILNWGAPAEDGGLSISNYIVKYKARDASVWDSATVSSTSSTLGSLVNGTTYDFEVQAVNGGGKKSVARTFSAKPKTYPVAVLVKDVVADSATAVTVYWDTLTAVSDTGGDDVTGYTVTETSTAKTCTVTGNSFSHCQITDLTPGSDYYFVIKATNGAGQGPNGASRSWRSGKLSQTVTIAVDRSSIEFGKGQITPSGTRQASTDLTYIVDPSSSSICEVDSSNKIVPKAAGTCKVRARNSGDGTYNSQDSDLVEITIDSSNPDSPTAVSASAGTTSAVVSWTAPTNTGGAALTSYTVTSVPGGFTCTATAPATSCTVTGLDPAVDYQFEVVATNLHNSTRKNSSASGRSSTIRPAAASTPKKEEPAPQIDRSPVTPAAPSTPKEPVKTAPKKDAVLPPVKGAPSAAPVTPANGNIITLKDGKNDAAVLTVTQQPAKSSTSSAPATAATTKAEVKGEDWSMAVVTPTASAPAAPSTGGDGQPATSVLTFEKGASAQTTGAGFAPRTYISVYLFSDPILIGKIRTDGYGNFKGSIKIPADLEVGSHTLQLNGLTKALEIRTASLPVTVFAKQAAAKPTPKPTATATPAAPVEKSEVTFAVNFGLNSWWVSSSGYNAIRAAIKQVPAGAKNITITVIGNKQQTKVDPYPNIGLDRAKAVVKAMRFLGFAGRYTAEQSNEPGLTTAEYRRADVTISWTAP